MNKYFPLVSGYIVRGYYKQKFNLCMVELMMYSHIEYITPAYYCMRCKFDRMDDVPYYRKLKDEIDMMFESRIYPGTKCFGCYISG